MADYDGDGEIIEQRSALPSLPESRPQNLIFSSANPGEVFGALCEMQGTMEAPKRTKKATVKGRSKGGAEYNYSYNYAPLDEIISTVKLPMKEVGLAYRQFLASRDGQWVMRTVIAHKTGEWFGCDYPIFWEQDRGMQGFASGVTYARRYGLMLALGIAAEDDDDANVADGNAATVQNRSTRPSGGRTASPTPQGNGSSPPASTAPTATEAEKTKARADYATLQIAIDDAPSEKEIDAIVTSADFSDLRSLVCKVEGEEPGRGYMAKLLARAERVKTRLHTEGVSNA